MRTLLISLVSIFLIVSCSSQSKNFANTKWTYDFGNGFKNCFLFMNDGTYKFYNAEIGEHYYGIYYTKKDTVFVERQAGEYDYEFPENSRHRVKRAKFKLIFKNNNQLGYLKNWDFDKKKWKENYYFTEEKK
jgi:hypothetical protein